MEVKIYVTKVEILDILLSKNASAKWQNMSVKHTSLYCQHNYIGLLCRAEGIVAPENSFSWKITVYFLDLNKQL